MPPIARTIVTMAPSPSPTPAERLRRARVALDGLSVGDAFGERYFLEPSLARSMIEQRALTRAPWKWTDDTAMALSIYRVLARCGELDCDVLACEFAASYRRDPARGYGGTAHEILTELGTGRGWREVAGAVFDGQGSMGNGGAMRAAPIGAYFAEDYARVAAEAIKSAAVTHAHPEGQAGAVAVAIAAAWAVRRGNGSSSETSMFDPVLKYSPAGATRQMIEAVARLPANTSVAEVVALAGNGSRVISEDTVPFALWCAQRHLDSYEDALWTTVSGLGDRDTTCAIVGGIVVFTSQTPIPELWIQSREPLEHEAPVIRRARPDDAPGIAIAQRQIAATPGKLASRPEEIDESAIRRSIIDLNERGRGIYIIAESEGQAVGHALLEPLPLAVTAHVVRVTLAVNEGQQRRGIGRALMNELLFWARATPEVEKVELQVRSSNEAAIALYRSLGFREEGRKTRRIKLAPDIYLDDIYMALWVGHQ